MTREIPVSMEKMLWGKIQGIHKREEYHSNAGDVEDPICVGFFHMKKGMNSSLQYPTSWI